MTSRSTTPAACAVQQPIWTADTRMPDYPPLQEDARADVCVVGAGIAGLSSAYLLSREGLSVIVLDDGPVAGGNTQMTTAHLSNVIDDRYEVVERLHGEEGARLTAASHSAAIDRIETIVRTERIDCDFIRLDGYLFLPPDGDQTLLDRELAAARRSGLDVARVSRAPFGPFDTGPCLRFPRQGQIHPLKYLAGVARALTAAGGRIFCATHADRIEGGDTARVQAAGHEVVARAVVVATNTPINDRLVIHTKQTAHITYAIGARVPRGSVPSALCWDTEDPYHYLRQAPHPVDAAQEILIVGGEDHKTGRSGDALSRHHRLEEWARVRFPQMGAVEFAWSGQVMETIDGLAFIGRNPADSTNVFIATGDSGMGMTHGTIAGILLTDLIMERGNPWTVLYDPSRKTLRAAGTFAKETLDMAARYAGWAAPGDAASVEEVAPGSGAVIWRGLSRVAAYRDGEGVLHERSAVCPHLGCVVQWNASAKTWDCPCHGSRFDCRGDVINGPANTPLGDAGDGRDG